MEEIGELFINQRLELGGCLTINDQFLWVRCLEHQNGIDIQFTGFSVDQIIENEGNGIKIGSLNYNETENHLAPYLYGTIEVNRETITIGVLVSLNYYIEVEDMEDLVFQFLKL